MSLIYVAGPYSAPTEEKRLANTDAAMEAGKEIIRKGHTPLVPHLSHFMDPNGEFDYERWMSICFDWLDCCDALLYLGSSPGAERERERSVQARRRIYYSLDEIPEAE
jgi:hypothetical protein